jgi:trans-2-enoyl-CoA reductase
MTDEQFVVEIVKASLPKTDEIVKAQVDEIRKAFETQIEALKAELKEIKEQPMVKAAVLIEKDGKVEGQPLNYEAVTKFMEKR